MKERLGNLVLTRKRDENFHIGSDVEVRVVRFVGHAVQLRITAPRRVPVVRGELRVVDDLEATDVESPDVRTCRVCGCTDEAACEVQGVPCLWVQEDLCSACAPVRMLLESEDAGLPWLIAVMARVAEAELSGDLLGDLLV